MLRDIIFLIRQNFKSDCTSWIVCHDMFKGLIEMKNLWDTMTHTWTEIKITIGLTLL